MQYQRKREVSDGTQCYAKATRLKTTARFLAAEIGLWTSAPDQRLCAGRDDVYTLFTIFPFYALFIRSFVTTATGRAALVDSKAADVYERSGGQPGRLL